jgi:mono/diheme cytochrome c family protein
MVKILIIISKKFFTLTLIALLAGPTIATAQPQDALDLWEGIFTKEQVDRGKKHFLSHCTFCHGENLNGAEGPPLRGSSFARNWSGHYLDRLYLRLKEKMPADNPSLVSDEEKLDILAFLLYTNGFPLGDKELILDLEAMSNIHIADENGLAPPMNGSLVGAVGCLERDLEGDYLLANSLEAFVTALEHVRPAESEFVKTAALGTEKYRLMDPYPKPDNYLGQKVFAKGFLILKENDNKINVITLEMVSTSCES